ncbi:hypothetical protein BS17DRAFT_153756 [Gyrodon lividus]|nr:hypothetical protein BS17DRAFT_153756 [Gyrodon lividus]
MALLTRNLSTRVLLNSLFSGKMDDAEHVEHPSAELQQASVIVQASQGQRHEDTDVEALKPVQQASSPARRVPNNLSDSPKRRLGEALSLLNVKSEEIQRLERELANEHGNMQKMKEELAKLRRSPEGSPRPTSDDLASREAERVRWSQDRSKWETDCATWETQRKEWSEERTNLSERVVALSEVAARAEEDTAKWQQLHSQCSDLEAERVAWMKEREKMTDDIAQRVEELTVLTRRCDEYNQAKITWATDQTKWEAERDAWAEEKVGWESERTALREEREALSQSVAMLTASVEVVTAAKVVAEKDRDFFREQYTQASGFVGSVSAENVELEKKAKIAEGQAQEGVAMIKALFENRVKALRDDIRRWKSLAELLQEKDNRTNDEVRLRAAQAPELEERCRRLAGENSSLEMDLRKLGQAQQRVAVQRNKLYHNVLMLKKERASLKSKLSQLVKAAGTSTQETSNPVPEDQTAPLPEDLESMEFNDMDILLDPLPQSGETSFDDTWFPCMWRPQFRDQCQQVFDSKEDLEKHLKEHFRDLAQ